MNTRMLMVTVFVAMFVLCQQVHAQAEDDPVMPEATELEGTWELVSCIFLGKQVESDRDIWRFESNRVYRRSSGPGNTFSLDPSAMPAEIDGVCNAPGIYEIDGHELRICIGVPLFRPEGWPDRFESTTDYPTRLWVLRRVPEEDDE